ncbi:hypothetical protein AB0G82_37475 [Streptomyces anulatus]|uniref:hypothetical protein n=1 Tax=Streptomyces anulatus TaxID=1892 RepID=UPI0033DBD731
MPLGVRGPTPSPPSSSWPSRKEWDEASVIKLAAVLLVLLALINSNDNDNDNDNDNK